MVRRLARAVLDWTFAEGDIMGEHKHKYWGRQIEGIANELSKLAIVCDIELGKDGLAERVLKNDESVCGRKNPAAFQLIRKHLMALFSVEEGAIDRLGAAETKDILDAVRTAIVDIRSAGGASQSLPREQGK